jgi:phage tail-like protein
VSEPFTAYGFRVDIVLPGASEPLCGAAFAECDGLELRLDVRSLREGGNNAGPVLLAGPASYGEVTLRRGMTESFDLWDWCGAVMRDPSLRADAVVTVLAPDHETVNARFRLRRCLPVRLKAPRLDAVDGIVAIEELQLACEALALDRPGGPPLPPAPKRKAELHELDPSFEREVNPDRAVQVQLNPPSLRLTTAEQTTRLALELWFDVGRARGRRAPPHQARRLLRGRAGDAPAVGHVPLRRPRRGARGVARALLCRRAPAARPPGPRVARRGKTEALRLTDTESI